MIGAFCAVTLSKVLNLYSVVIDPTKTDFLGNALKVKVPYVVSWFGESAGMAIINWSVPLAIIAAIPVMVLIGFAMERGLIKHFYKAPARRSDPGDLWPGHCYAGDYQGLFWCQSNPDTGTGFVQRVV